MLRVTFLYVIMLSVTMPNVIMQYVIMPMADTAINWLTSHLYNVSTKCLSAKCFSTKRHGIIWASDIQLGPVI